MNMSRKQSKTTLSLWDGVRIYAIILAIVGIEARLHKTDTLYVIWILIALSGIGLIIEKILMRIRLRRRLQLLDEVDIMTGTEFEEYLVKLLKGNGFENVSITEKYDMGVDIIGEKNGERWGIQAKRYNGLVKASAVRQVIAGLNSYNCTRSMVMTNSTFSNYAIKLARSNHCILIDRMELAKIISDTR